MTNSPPAPPAWRPPMTSADLTNILLAVACLLLLVGLLRGTIR